MTHSKLWIASYNIRKVKRLDQRLEQDRIFDVIRSKDGFGWLQPILISPEMRFWRPELKRVNISLNLNPILGNLVQPFVQNEHQALRSSNI